MEEAFPDPEFSEVLDALANPGPFAPQIRAYLVSNKLPPEAELRSLVPQYEIVVPNSTGEAAFIRQITLESEDQFRGECSRIGAILAPRLPGHSALDCFYDDEKGQTRFHIEFRKSALEADFTAL